MKKRNNKIDWSNQRFKQLLVDTRKYLWLDDTINRIGAWAGLRQGMSVVDVGCGLGYLGYTYWSFYGKAGRYIGVDINAKLLKDAKKLAKGWAKRRTPFFVTGDVYKLPLRDNCVDCVMCQTLFIQIKEPKRALAEMVRVLKPGGIVMCVEPDNLSWRTSWSLPDFSIKEKLLLYKYDLIWNRGRIKLGQGDYTIGNKVPHMMRQAGLIDVDARINDMVFILEPPYESPMQQYQLNVIKKDLRAGRKDRKFWRNEERRQFLAGGGNIKDFNRVMKIFERLRPKLKRQVEKRQFFRCSSGLFYVIKGRKPKS